MKDVPWKIRYMLVVTAALIEQSNAMKTNENIDNAYE